MSENEKQYYFRAEQLSAGYGGEPLIRNIGFRLERGKILTLIGPNGSGKSTILRSIAGQLKKSGGAVFLKGRNTDFISRRELAEEMAAVLTERVRPELMTCAEMAAAGRYPYTGRLGILSQDDRKKVREALRAVDMEDYADREFRSVSDGQQQRVLLARVICQEPELIILDEPTSYLDIRYKLELFQILRGLVERRGITVIMSLHELELAQKVSDYILCVRDGRADRYGTPEEILTEEYIRQLYDLDNGYYSEIFGSVEMKNPAKMEDVETGRARLHGEAEEAFPDRKKEGKEAGPGRAPEIFVIAGGGSGSAVFRKLNRRGVSFAAGVLHRNDIDYELARMLADRVISEKPYARISEAAYEEALLVMKTCGRVICCLEDDEFGEMNEENRRLLREAEKAGIAVRKADFDSIL